MEQLFSFSFFILSILICITSSAPISPEDCPFANENNCNCTSDSSSPDTFINVTCVLEGGRFNPFNTSVNTYTVTGRLLLVTGPSDVTVQAGSFVAFKSISELSIVSVTKEGILFNVINLDPLSFAGPRIAALAIRDFQNVLPLPAAIRDLGREGLQSLIIQRSLIDSLGPDEFQDFNNLTSLALIYCRLTSLDDAVFSGLEDTLVDLTVEGGDIPTYPLKALSGLTKLEKLDLDDTGIVSFPKAAFASFVQLRDLTLSATLVQSAIDAGAFDQLPSTVERLTLIDGQLSTVPTGVIAAAPKLSFLSLTANQIYSVRKDDFPKTNVLTELDLGNNYIDNIDAEAFRSLTSTKTLLLDMTTLRSIDFSLFQGMLQLEELSLSDQTHLQNVTVSSPDEVPPNIRRVDLSRAHLNNIDPNFQDIVERENFEFLDIGYNRRLECDEGLQWMARYAFCDPVRINIYKTFCINQGKSLKEYLQETVQNPCQ